MRLFVAVLAVSMLVGTAGCAPSVPPAPVASSSAAAPVTHEVAAPSASASTTAIPKWSMADGKAVEAYVAQSIALVQAADGRFKSIPFKYVVLPENMEPPCASVGWRVDVCDDNPYLLRINTVFLTEASRAGMAGGETTDGAGAFMSIMMGMLYALQLKNGVPADGHTCFWHAGELFHKLINSKAMTTEQSDGAEVFISSATGKLLSDHADFWDGYFSLG